MIRPETAVQLNMHMYNKGYDEYWCSEPKFAADLFDLFSLTALEGSDVDSSQSPLGNYTVNEVSKTLHHY